MIIMTAFAVPIMAAEDEQEEPTEVIVPAVLEDPFIEEPVVEELLEEELLDEDIAEETPETLPETGGMSALLVTGVGTLLTGVGVTLRKKNR